MFRRLIYHFISNILVSSLCSALSALAVFFPSMTAAGHVQADVVASSSAAVEVQSAPEVTLLEPRKPIERVMAGGQEHKYQIRLGEGQYASVIIEQRGIDVRVQLLEMQGKVIAGIDGEYRSQGEEKVEMVGGAAGSYRLSVRASSNSAPAGAYNIRVAEIRAATRDDRLLHEARQLLWDTELALMAGKYEDARQLAERALAIAENVLGMEHPFVATLLGDLAYYYDEKQDFSKAVSLLERAVAIREKTSGDEHPHTVVLSRLLAFLYYETNEVAKAERLAARALEISEKTLGPEHYLVAQCLHTLSQVTRDPNKSEQLLQRALMVAEKTGGAEHMAVGLMLNALGVFYTEKGDFQQAEQFLMRAQGVYEKTLGPESISHVVNLHNLGRIARERKDYAKAEDYYRKAIAIVEKSFGPENPRLAFILNNIANIYRAKGEYQKSLEAHLRVLRIAEKTRGPYHPFTLLSLGNIAKTYAAQGNIAEAIRFQSRVDAVIERNIEMNLAVGSERQKLSYLNGTAERTDRTISLNSDLAPNDPAASALAAMVLLQRKGRLLDALSESFASLRQRSTPEEQALFKQFNDATAQLARFVLNGPQKISYEEHQKKVSDLEEQKERVEVEISRRSAEFRAVSQPVTLAAVQAAIPTGAALIEFAVYRPFDPKAESNSEAYKEPRYIAYVLRRTGEVRWRDLGDAKAIDEAIGFLRETLRDPLRRDARKRARDVDEKVMQPVRALIGDTNQLLISPDGALNLIPFEALVDEQGRYLIQRYSFAYLTSGRDLLRLQVARTGHNSSLVIADPSFGEPDLPQQARAGDADDHSRAKNRESKTIATDLSSVYFAPLTGAAQEARSIKLLFPEADILLSQQATESSLKQSAAPRILHIATHGFFLTDGPASSAAGPNLQATRAISASAKVENPLLRSGLALAGANLHRSSGDDGILTALEASGLNLWGTKLVTLSACDTGLGEVKNGEGVYGLRRAFVLAGTETLVMSLWPVSDYVTREMMTAYYKGLKQGQGRGEALRQVQLGMLKRKGREHPFYWASFIQSGEWANLDGKR
jgi:CHAT domain-containing protein/Tfp pilus assembly protein PilF